MAYLLGSAEVMEMLQRDVRDVQETVTDIISHVGPMNFTSWKFPDKQSCDLDIEDLLDLYSYSDDDEERQVAHIALYELVIDRLVLVLQSMGLLTDRMLKTAHCDVAGGGPGTSTSAGLVVKRYWTRLSQLSGAVKQLSTEKSALNRKVSEVEGDVSRLNLEIKQIKSSPQKVGFGGLIPPNRAEMAIGKSLDPRTLKELGFGLGYGRDEYNKSCQTSETAFTPCDSCSCAQKCLRQTGDLVVGICQQQQIPSCLQKFRPQVNHLDWLPGSDVSRWSAEQNKDLQRISKLTATIKPTRDELSECNKKCDKLQNRVTNFDRDMKQEKDTKLALSRQYEAKLKEIETQNLKTLELEQHQRELLEQSKEHLENLLEKHKSELQEHQHLLQELETRKVKMESELSNNKTNLDEVKKLEGEMSGLQQRMDTVTTTMEKSTKELHKEQAINKSVSKHTQSLQAKQDTLLKRIDKLDQENVDLRDQVAEVEEEKEKIEESVDGMKRETTQIQRQLREKQVELDQGLADKESLEQTIGTLETSLQNLTDRLEEAKERERLIVEYPDINGPVNPDLTGTGDIVLDMDNQVKANTLRIELLEKQNEGLRNSIVKLRLMQQTTGETVPGKKNATYNQSSKPQPLWDPNYLGRVQDNRNPNINMNNANTPNTKQQERPDNYSQQGGHRSGIQTFQFQDVPVSHCKPGFEARPTSGIKPRPATGGKIKTKDDFVVGRAERPHTGFSQKRDTSAKSVKSRPASGKAMAWAPVNSTSIGAYMQLKKEGKLNTTYGNQNTPGPPPAQAKSRVSVPSSGNENYNKQENFTCDRCDKMYTRVRDLEIHQSYCTA